MHFDQMARSKKAPGVAHADVVPIVPALKILSFKGLDPRVGLCGVFLVLSMVAVAYLGVSVSPGEVFLPVLGSKLLTGTSTLRAEQQVVANNVYSQQQRVEYVHIQDVVALPDQVLLLMKTPPLYQFPDKKDLACVFGNKAATRVQGIDNHRYQTAAVRCVAPSERVEARAVSLKKRNGRGLVQSSQVEEVLKWNLLTFEAVLTPKDVVLFAKGIVTKRGYELNAKDLRCVFDDSVETKVISAAQEVFRCAHPELLARTALAGTKVTLKVNGSLVPSVARYEQTGWHWKETPTKKHFLCSCTMIFNIGKFLKEWVMYNAQLGVERFFFYDNNSEDNLEHVLEELRKYNVSQHHWPWIKSQEAGFSHCALRAQSECTWMIYADVDEFVLPKAWLRISSQPLVTLVQEMSAPRACRGCKTLRSRKAWYTGLWNPWQSTNKKAVGQIFLGCRVFGPSGLQKHPLAGVTQGYTCRMKNVQRHKSIVLLDAVDRSLLNVVHHFKLQPNHVNVSVPSGKGIINHYKYQAWEEFKTKFRRRVSAYVADWKQDKNMDSKDRTPGLGTKEIEPRNWKRKFCEVNDTGLRNYVAKTFGLKDEKGFLRMPWQ